MGAMFVKHLHDFHGDAALYRLEPPFLEHDWRTDHVEDDCRPGLCPAHEYVVVSAVDAMYSGPETLVFPADSEGNVASWGDIGGGRGYKDHSIALLGMGYES